MENNQNRYKKYARTKNGLISRIFSNQKANSKRRGHTPPTYSKEELSEWLHSQTKFHLLYDNWKRLDYQSRYRPSVDRKDDNIGYTMSNIQLMTWGENKAKGYNSMKNGEIEAGVRAVIQYSKDMIKIKVFYSTSEASRQTGVNQGHISEVCNGKRKTAGKFIWRFKDEK